MQFSGDFSICSNSSVAIEELPESHQIWNLKDYSLHSLYLSCGHHYKTSLYAQDKGRVLSCDDLLYPPWSQESFLSVFIFSKGKKSRCKPSCLSLDSPMGRGEPINKENKQGLHWIKERYLGCIYLGCWKGIADLIWFYLILLYFKAKKSLQASHSVLAYSSLGFLDLFVWALLSHVPFLYSPTKKAPLRIRRVSWGSLSLPSPQRPATWPREGVS